AVNTIRNRSRVVVSFWDDHDILVTPTLTQGAHPIGYFADAEHALARTFEWINFTYPYNCTGQPAISLPLGMSSTGLPLGVQLVGPPRGEMLLLGVARELEAAMPWKDRRPPVMGLRNVVQWLFRAAGGGLRLRHMVHLRFICDRSVTKLRPKEPAPPRQGTARAALQVTRHVPEVAHNEGCSQRPPPGGGRRAGGAPAQRAARHPPHAGPG